MIEQGITLLVTSNPQVAALTPAGGGFFVELPKNQTLPSWTYLTVFDSRKYGLQSQPGLVEWRVQIDCFSENDNGAGCISLAAAIYNVLSGFRGALTDPDNTFVDSVFYVDMRDFFDSERRSWRRMLEFTINYYLPAAA